MMKSRPITVCGLIAVFLFALAALSFTACEQPTDDGGSSAPQVITIAAIQGLTPPVPGGTPVKTITANDQYTGTVTWDGWQWDGNTFATLTRYWATITLTPKKGYTLEGVGDNFFTVAKAQYVEYRENSPGIITVGFPETGEIALPANAIMLSAHTWTDGTIADEDDEQWFKFTATDDAHHIHFEHGELSNVNLHLYDSTGTRVGQAEHYSNSDPSFHEVIPGDEYYIRITPHYYNYTYGNFRIALNTSFIPPGAVPLNADRWADGVSASGSDVQWFSFTATADYQYIHFKGPYNAAVHLYDSTGIPMGDGESLYYEGYTSQTVTAGGEYYIKVTVYDNGSYQIGFNDSSTPPSLITLPTVNVTRLTADTYADGVLASWRDVQWFKFTATAALQYIHVDSGTSWMSMQLYDRTGAPVGSEETLYYFVRSTSLPLTVGDEYYVKMRTWDDGCEYRIAFNGSIVPPGVITLTAGLWAEGNAGVTEQWFTFTATEDTRYVHLESAAASVTVQLYDRIGTRMGDGSVLNSNSRFAALPVTIGDEYYFRVSPNSGSNGVYRIGLSGSFVPPGSGVTALVFNTWANGVIDAGSSAAADSEQWFKFTATANTNYIHFELGTLDSVYVQLYDSTGTRVGDQTRLYDSQYGTRYTSRSVTNGAEYYIRVTPYNNGSGLYRIGFTNNSSAPTMTALPTANVPSLSSTWQVGAIAGTAANREQWFKFTATAAAHCIHFEPGSLTDVNVQLYTSGGITQGSQIRLNSTTLYAPCAVTVGNVYYVKVMPYTTNGSGTSGTYKIAVTDSFLPPGTGMWSASADGTSYNPAIAANGVQWFRFTATAAIHYFHFTPETLTSANVQLYTLDGAPEGGQTTLNGDTRYTYRSVNNGTEYLLKVTPAGGGSGTYRIRINTWFIDPLLTITTLNANTYTNGSITTSTGEQWFKFTATAANQWIHFEPGALAAVNMQVCTTMGDTVGDRAILNSSARYVSRPVTSGDEYYIKITPNGSSSGAYRIAYNTMPVSPETTIIPLTANTWENGTVAVNGEQWFKFTATNSTHYIHFEPGTLAGVNVQLYNNSGTVGNPTALSLSSFYSSRSVTNDTEYYIRVTPSGSGASGGYRIAFNTSSISPAITLPTANITPLVFDIWKNGNAGGVSGNVQWYKFTATASGQFVHIDLGSLSSNFVQVYSNTGALLNWGRADSSKSFVTISLSAGSECYVKVTSDSNAYRIAFNASPVPPDMQVTALPFNTWVDGNIPSDGVQEQWFKFTATAANHYIHFEPGTMVSVRVGVYSSSGTTGGQSSFSLMDPALLYSVTNGAEYYVKVTPNSDSRRGTYQIGFNTSSTVAPPITLPTGGVTQLVFDTWRGGNLPQDGEQWFKFTATSSTHSIHLSNGRMINGVYIQVYDNIGTLVKSRTRLAYYETTDLPVSLTLTAGKEYYIRVTPFLTTDYGTYSIGYNSSTTRPSKITPPADAYELIVNSTWAEGSWFKFTATAEKQFIHFRGTGGLYTEVQLYDTTGTKVGDSTQMGRDYAAYTLRTLTSGTTYYINVQVNNGSIGVSTSVVPPGNSIINLPLDAWTEENRIPSDGVQWYRTSGGANVDLHFKPESILASVNVQVYNSNGVAVGNRVSMNAGTPYASWSLTPYSDLFYFKVTSYFSNSDSGAYRLGRTGSTKPPAN